MEKNRVDSEGVGGKDSGSKVILKRFVICVRVLEVRR